MHKIFLFFLCCSLKCLWADAPPFVFFPEEKTQSHLISYSEEEQIAIYKDLEIVKSVCLPPFYISTDKPTYLATAGAPGARKSTILERFMDRYQLGKHFVYLDPDQRALKFMAHTYFAQSLSALKLGEEKDYALIAQRAYEKWRAASNYITYSLLEEAFASKLSVAHGTTSTSSHTKELLQVLKKSGYSVTLLVCFAEDTFRQTAIDYRNNHQKFYQSTPEDAHNKKHAFLRSLETYFQEADELYFFWSRDLFNKETLAAKLSKTGFEVFDTEALSQIIDQIETQTPDLQWEKLINLYLGKSQR